MGIDIEGYLACGRSRAVRLLVARFLTLADLFLISRARECLFDAVYPLLRAIGLYAGCYVSLIAGNSTGPTDEGFFTA